MRKRHNKQGEHGVSALRDKTHLYDAATQDVPRFKHRQSYRAPRYSPVLALAWAACLFCAIIRYTQGIRGTWNIDRWDTHYILDGATCTVMLILVSLLWSAWEREERYPELLPKEEFERRYPPGSGAPPEREYHRRIPYVEDVTATGTTVDPQPLRRTEYPE